MGRRQCRDGCDWDDENNMAMIPLEVVVVLWMMAVVVVGVDDEVAGALLPAKTTTTTTMLLMLGDSYNRPDKTSWNSMNYNEAAAAAETNYC